MKIFFNEFRREDLSICVTGFFLVKKKGVARLCNPPGQGAQVWMPPNNQLWRWFKSQAWQAGPQTPYHWTNWYVGLASF